MNTMLQYEELVGKRVPIALNLNAKIVSRKSTRVPGVVQSLNVHVA